MHYKDEPLIDDRHHLLTPQQNCGSVEPKVAVQYSRPYFFPSQCKRKNSGLATRDYKSSIIARHWGFDSKKSYCQFIVKFPTLPPCISAINQKLVGRFTAVSLKMYGEIWPIKIDFGRLNGEVGRKMANGGLLFLALMYVQGKG